MKRLALILAVAFTTSPLAFQATNTDLARWKQEAANVTIVRDNWGIAHVFGKTDADAVFGMEYAQAEDDFNRVETNYINAMGRLAETEGESQIYRDLRMKLFIDPDVLKKDYASSPAWLKALMNAFADGLNFYLYSHPEVKPRVITHFEPWMALSFTEGSIGGDIERVNLRQLQAFYGGATARQAEPATPAVGSDFQPPPEPSGSNGIAIAPSNTVDHHALLLINPHTSFYFRSELQMVSDEGLDAYGAVTWGQFFIYQGFNPHVGWMHTSSAVDAIDQFLETVTKRGDRYYYKHGADELPVDQSVITVPYKTDQGMASKTFTVYRTMHGPVIGEVNGKWETIALMNEPVKALTQSYTRTKATDYKSFLQTMQLHTNSSNNTIYADSDGDIAYFHGNYIPRRDPSFDWTRPVDGSNPATDYHGLLSVDESPHLLNPASGWLYNSNDSPWNAAGPSSPKQADFPTYVDNGRPSARGQHAVRVLQDKKDFTLDGLLAAAFDSYLTWFEKPIPALIKAWDEAPATNPLKAKLADQIDVLRHWNLRWGADSIATSLAVYWGTDLRRAGGGRGRGAGAGRGTARAAGAGRGAGRGTAAARGATAGRAAAAGRGAGRGTAAGRGMFQDRVGSMPPDVLLQSLANASDKLTADFGTWKTPWGDINRFQRLNDNIVGNFDDSKPSIPVPFTSATWGSLASFGARQYPNTKKWYGTSGNSFVAVVEFGPTIHARAVTAGGESGDPKSPHFDDEAERYASGNLREVYFYRSQLTGHTERTYHPGS